MTEIFPPYGDMFPAVFGVTTAHRATAEPAPDNTLPTEPGVYIIDRPTHHGFDHWWVGSAIFELSRTGYWAVDRTPRTADEVDAIRHGQRLIALIPESEGDL